ncbi:MAG: hypothetical protein HYT80_08465 [Euryarchaeota archaeon]|nr:hypothetical protein [Euryarchaeota archaeon]
MPPGLPRFYPWYIGMAVAETVAAAAVLALAEGQLLFVRLLLSATLLFAWYPAVAARPRPTENSTPKERVHHCSRCGTGNTWGRPYCASCEARLVYV